MDSCPDSDLIQFTVQASHFLSTDHCSCWMARVQRNGLLFWNADQLLRMILAKEKKNPTFEVKKNMKRPPERDPGSFG